MCVSGKKLELTGVRWGMVRHFNRIVKMLVPDVDIHAYKENGSAMLSFK